MDLELLPTLALARELYAAPRDAARFRRYLAALRADDGDLALPIAAMNPMAKGHLLGYVDALLALDAEAVVQRALDEARSEVARGPGRLRVAVVVADDVAGGWTNRYTTDAAHRFESGPLLDRDFAVALLFASDPPSKERVREETLVAVFRAAYQRARGAARTLGEKLDQEREVRRRAGLPAPALPPAERARARATVTPLLGSFDAPTMFACLYGDAAAVQLGYTPLGLGPLAGLSLAQSA